MFLKVFGARSVGEKFRFVGQVRGRKIARFGPAPGRNIAYLGPGPRATNWSNQSRGWGLKFSLGNVLLVFLCGFSIYTKSGNKPEIPVQREEIRSDTQALHRALTFCEKF